MRAALYSLIHAGVRPAHAQIARGHWPAASSVDVGNAAAAERPTLAADLARYATIFTERFVGRSGMAVILPDRFAGFRLVRPLGNTGGFGAVYEAEHDGERVALKIFHAELIDEVELERFQREVRGLCKVRHANLVAYADSGSTEHAGRRWHWIAMELLTGRSLRSLDAGARRRCMPGPTGTLARIGKGLS